MVKVIDFSEEKGLRWEVKLASSLIMSLLLNGLSEVELQLFLRILLSVIFNS